MGASSRRCAFTHPRRLHFAHPGMALGSFGPLGGLWEGCRGPKLQAADGHASRPSCFCPRVELHPEWAGGAEYQVLRAPCCPKEENRAHSAALYPKADAAPTPYRPRYPNLDAQKALHQLLAAYIQHVKRGDFVPGVVYINEQPTPGTHLSRVVNHAIPHDEFFITFIRADRPV